MCEIEQVCSGPGLKHIYEFVCTSRNVQVDAIEPAEVRFTNCFCSEPSYSMYKITKRALSSSCEICLETLNMFLEILVFSSLWSLC